MDIYEYDMPLIDLWDPEDLPFVNSSLPGPRLVVTMRDAFRLEFYAQEVYLYPDISAEVNAQHHEAVREWVSYLIDMIGPMIKLSDHYKFTEISPM